MNSRATAEAASLLHPLDAYQGTAPIEDFGDIAPGLAAAMKFNGKLAAVPSIGGPERLRSIPYGTGLRRRKRG